MEKPSDGQKRGECVNTEQWEMEKNGSGREMDAEEGEEEGLGWRGAKEEREGWSHYY